MSYNNYDNEREDRYIALLRSHRFYKWLSIISTILTLIALLNYCVLPSKYRYHYHGYNIKHNPITNSFKNNEPKISAYQIMIPSNYCELNKPTTLRQLSNRWHVSINDIQELNPWLQQTAPSTPIKPSQPIDVPQTNNPAQPPGTGEMNSFESQVLMLTNKERSNVGLKPLSGNDATLNKSARLKSQDMADKNYFDHNSPTYGSPFDMMKHFGITYNAAAENIAKGQRTPEEVVNAWMNSSGHRANLLNAQFTHIGVGYVSKGNVWTQQFISK